MTRICTVCSAVKELDEFPKATHGKDGRRNQCTECRKTYNRANSKLYYQKHRTVKLARTIERERQLREQGLFKPSPFRNTDAFRERERLRSVKRRADPTGNKHRAFLVRRYLARKLNAPGYTTKAQLQARWDYYGHKCWICANDATETDHVKPISKGGSNWPVNLRPICKTCNVRKSNTWPYPIKQRSNGGGMRVPLPL